VNAETIVAFAVLLYFAVAIAGTAAMWTAWRDRIHERGGDLAELACRMLLLWPFVFFVLCRELRRGAFQREQHS
jgi:hypothetical protein